ncbi:hypothetical protein [Methylorubrum zatmanii]
MPHSAVTDQEGRPASVDQYRLALAEAVSGLELIRDEGPEAEPAYPKHGEIEAHETWAFDSASYERAQTAREALEHVALIMGGSAPPA